MPRLLRPITPYKPGPQGPITLFAAQQAFDAARAAMDLAERRYAISDNVHMHIFLNRNDAFALNPVIAIERNSDDFPMGSAWPGEVTPQEMVKAAEIKSMIDDWVSGKRPFLPDSTYTKIENPDADGPPLYY